MDQKMIVNLCAALVPLVLGAIWYNPNLLGKLWGSALNTSPLSPAKLAITVLLTFVAGYYIARSLSPIVIHQNGLHGMLAGDPDLQNKSSALSIMYQTLMDKYGRNYRTFKHGAWHGLFIGLYLILPVLVVVGLWENKKVSWILIHASFWTLCITIMGGIVCQFMP